MELLEKAQFLYQEMRAINEAQAFVEKRVRSGKLTEEELEHANREEFRLSMDLASVYRKLEKNLDKLSKEEGMDFLAGRIRKNASALMNVGVISVRRDV